MCTSHLAEGMGSALCCPRKVFTIQMDRTFPVLNWQQNLRPQCNFGVLQVPRGSTNLSRRARQIVRNHPKRHKRKRHQVRPHHPLRPVNKFVFSHTQRTYITTTSLRPDSTWRSHTFSISASVTRSVSMRNSPLAPRVNTCCIAFIRISREGIPAVPEIVSGALRSTAAGRETVAPALSPTCTSRVS